MKVFNIVMKVVLALTAVAGAVYLAATYGDKIVAWAKKMLGSCKCCCQEAEDTIEAPEAPAEETTEETAEEAAEEAPAEEAPAEEAPAEETDVTAAETDFEG